MKKFGFGRRGDGDEDSNRLALFGSRSKSTSPAPASSNPYAQPPPAADPYANTPQPSYGPSGPSPYQQAKQTYLAPATTAAPAAAPGFGAGRGGLPNGPAPYNGGYGGPPAPAAVSRTPAPNGGGYAADRYGSGGGYGANRYGGPSADTGGSRYGPSGYGGLGRTISNETTSTEDNREALFAGAKERYAQKNNHPHNNGQPDGGHAAESSTPGAEGTDSGYGTYGDERQLTSEEQEEEDVQATKQQIRFMKQEDVSSTRNALRLAHQAEETGRATLARLGAQGDRIHNTEKNLDLASNHNRIAEEKSKELKTLNRSMFAVHVSNPFTASSRRAERDQEIIEKHRAEREQRDATRQAAFGTQQRMERAFRDLRPGETSFRSKASLAERAKYQFEADSEDDEMENEIDHNLDALGHAAGRLNALARATGREVDEQNKHIDKIIEKSDRVDDQIAMNRARLDRIH
ncbi:hypothetical protein M430DRAFT_16958 [Amorphotheca resinae ATCC 22711]|uniref:Protein transport protein SEC9 n=1 Tax=Amorphotheca resinae ATCC 22711 TaxID=857342 RepID=A0A2T3B855_AMORE|nr:hypothetical protein M430DRAFT_16958 [Amorphotheca resinae ATCC 22711]PSS23021.1 hypothetical protein M430DRAFT_16958 [Amorphotheca resinae ATCC 22711]